MVSQDEILGLLLGRGTVTRKEIADEFCCSSAGGSNLSRPIFQLEKHGYVKVERTHYRDLEVTLLDRKAARRRLGLL